MTVLNKVHRVFIVALSALCFSSFTQAATVDFTDDGTLSVSSYSQDGVTVTGSGDINFLNLNGLGIVGGSFDNTVDGDEWIKFAFDMPAQNVSYWIASAGQSGGSLPGQRTIEAFGIGGVSLGTFEENWTGSSDVSALFGGVLIESFTLTAQAVTNFRVGSVDFDLVTVSAVPLPAAIPLYASGMAILGFVGWRRRRPTV